MFLLFICLFLLLVSKNTFNSCILCPAAWLLMLLSGGERVRWSGCGFYPHILPFLPFLLSKGIRLLKIKKALTTSAYGHKDGPSHLFPASPPEGTWLSGRQTLPSSPLSTWMQLCPEPVFLLSWGFSNHTGHVVGGILTYAVVKG